ncbi:hypothetical protein Peur_050489 [Populus x canadensis]
MPLEFYQKDHQFELASQKICGAFMPQIRQETGSDERLKSEIATLEDVRVDDSCG